MKLTNGTSDIISRTGESKRYRTGSNKDNSLSDRPKFLIKKMKKMHQTFESNTLCESMVNEGNMSVSAAFTMAWVPDWEGD